MTEPINYAQELQRLRSKLGLTRHAMAELLYTTGQTYQSWEAGAQPRSQARSRIAKFLDSAWDQLDTLALAGIEVDNYTPLNLAASHLGVPHETLFHAYRDGGFQGKDLGILGIWVKREDLEQIMESVK